MRRALFLDIDGVVNSEPFLRNLPAGLPNAEDFDPALMIDPVLVGRLNRIVEGMDVKIVVSSSWRHGYKFGLLRNFLKRRGLATDLHDKTPTIPGDRANEIRAWLGRQFPLFDRFVVLDDNEDAGIGMKTHFVQTSWTTGLTEEDVERARGILGAR